MLPADLPQEILGSAFKRVSRIFLEERVHLLAGFGALSFT
jgi:hypothetical protein